MNRGVLRAYRKSAFRADLRREHGSEPVRQGLELLGVRDKGNSDEWDAVAHARAVRRRIPRLMERQARDEIPT